MESLLFAELDRKVTVTENGVERSLTKREAIVWRLVNGELKGKVKDLEILVRILRETGPADPISFSEDDDRALAEALAVLKPPHKRRGNRA